MKRQRLLEQVGGHLVMRWLPMLFMSLMFCLCFLSFFITNGRHAPSIIVCIALIPCFLIEFQVASINRRLDAWWSCWSRTRRNAAPAPDAGMCLPAAAMPKFSKDELD